jgi:hypothetical protein
MSTLLITVARMPAAHLMTALEGEAMRFARYGMKVTIRCLIKQELIRVPLARL